MSAVESKRGGVVLLAAQAAKDFDRFCRDERERVEREHMEAFIYRGMKRRKVPMEARVRASHMRKLVASGWEPKS